MAEADRHRVFCVSRRADNGAALSSFRYHVTDLWRRSLQRRSQRDRCTWKRTRKLVDAWLPQPRILHPWPRQRFAVKHPRWEPYAGVLHVRIMRGALGNGCPYRDQRMPG